MLASALREDAGACEMARRLAASVENRRNDADVPAEMEDEVVNIRRCNGAQRGQLCRRLLLIEHVERPVSDGSTPQMRMEEPAAKVRAYDDRVDTGSLLLRP